MKLNPRPKSQVQRPITTTPPSHPTNHADSWGTEQLFARFSRFVTKPERYITPDTTDNICCLSRLALCNVRVLWQNRNSAMRLKLGLKISQAHESYRRVFMDDGWRRRTSSSATAERPREAWYICWRGWIISGVNIRLKGYVYRQHTPLDREWFY